MELFGNDKEIARNKIILLYIIETLKVPMANLQLTKFITDIKIMNYFLLQQFLDELCESGFLTTYREDDKNLYAITANGRDMLENLSNLIPFGIKTKVDNAASQMRRSLQNDLQVTADFTPRSENEYIVSCKVSEGDFLILSLEVTAGTRNDARTLCENWKMNYSGIYSEIIESLIRDRPHLT